jgi:hypothetical protein
MVVINRVVIRFDKSLIWEVFAKDELYIGCLMKFLVYLIIIHLDAND